jgi:hypothetical protein
MGPGGGAWGWAISVAIKGPEVSRHLPFQITEPWLQADSLNAYYRPQTANGHTCEKRLRLEMSNDALWHTNEGCSKKNCNYQSDEKI